MNKATTKDWSYTLDAERVVWLTFDKQDATANTLGQAQIKELMSIVQTLKATNDVKALVLQSGKPNGFVAGANIEEFKQFKTPEAAYDFIREGQLALNALAALPFPSIAVVDGFCLGGGFELALACKYRILIDSPKTKMGLPEVKLGIHPGWGGCIRLPQLIGTLPALDLILTGKTLNARAAGKLKIGLSVPARMLKAAIANYCYNPPPAHKLPKYEAMFKNSLVRGIVANQMRAKLAKKIQVSHYPAPYKVIDFWQSPGIYQGDTSYQAEGRSLAELVPSSSAHNLVKVFFLSEKLKALGKQDVFAGKHVHVVGAGTMGGDIAAFCAMKGFKVTLQDNNPKAIATAIKRAAGLFKKVIKEPHLVQRALDNLMPDSKGQGVALSDVIIEAIVEKLEAKQSLFKALEASAKSDAILASNTSTIPLNEMSSVLKNPKRLVGIHFFNPVAKMPLIEIIQDSITDAGIVKRTLSFVGALDKLPVLVKSAPGFLVNRLLMPYIMESVSLSNEGVSVASIDQAAKDFGMPMGPLELADTVGLDVCAHAAKNLQSDPNFALPDNIKSLIEKGHLGRKSGQGFYRYQNDRLQPFANNQTSSNGSDISDRLILRLCNEAVNCLADGIVSEADYLDAGMVFGAGFAPFRGGPLAYIRSRGIAECIQALKQLEEKHGERYKPVKAWYDLAKLM